MKCLRNFGFALGFVVGVTLVGHLGAPAHAGTSRISKRNRQQSAVQVARTQAVPHAPWPGLFGVLLSMTGCGDGKAASMDCPEVTYSPVGTSPYADADFRKVVEACRPDQITDWTIWTEGPALTESCQDAILSFIPMDTTFRTGTVGKGVDVREKLVRGVHALLFTPLSDTGDILGSRSDADYCPAVYQDYLGLSRSGGLVSRKISASDYDSGLSAVNAHLVRFIFERMGKFKYEDGDGDRYARESGGDIYLTRNFDELWNPLVMAGVIVHEARHTLKGFPDGSDHVECVAGDAQGTDNCDDSMFGAYGSMLSYLDAAFKGAILTTLPDGRSWLDESQAKDLLSTVCTYYQQSINIQDGDLAAICAGDPEDDIDAFLSRTYGVAQGTVQFRVE